MLIYQAALSFLGLGGNPSMPDWGVMLNEGRGFVQQVPLLTLCPAGLLALFVWLANRLADTLGQSPVQTQKRIPAKIYHPTIDQS
jgi:ABC-type dipeptide/oligopeptide/nickel transport system permease subunit